MNPIAHFNFFVGFTVLCFVLVQNFLNSNEKKKTTVICTDCRLLFSTRQHSGIHSSSHTWNIISCFNLLKSLSLFVEWNLLFRTEQNHVPHIRNGYAWNSLIHWAALRFLFLQIHWAAFRFLFCSSNALFLTRNEKKNHLKNTLDVVGVIGVVVFHYSTRALIKTRQTHNHKSNFFFIWSR